MSNPSGDYSFAGLGFNGLKFFQDGNQYIGYLYYGEGSSIPVSNATYTDGTGVVTFSASESPAGVRALNFTGNIILDPTGNVTAIAGTWTGLAFIVVLPAAARAEPTIYRIPPINPIVNAHGAWTAYNRQNIIP